MINVIYVRIVFRFKQSNQNKKNGGFDMKIYSIIYVQILLSYKIINFIDCQEQYIIILIMN